MLAALYRMGGKNEKEEIASLLIAFGYRSLRGVRNDSGDGGRYTEPRESGKKGGFRIRRSSECRIFSKSADALMMYPSACTL